MQGRRLLKASDWKFPVLPDGDSEEIVMEFGFLECTECKSLMQSEEVTVLDIRDPQSFAAGHIEGALHVEQIDIESFVEEQPKDAHLVICC